MIHALTALLCLLCLLCGGCCAKGCPTLGERFRLAYKRHELRMVLVDWGVKPHLLPLLLCLLLPSCCSVVDGAVERELRGRRVEWLKANPTSNTSQKWQQDGVVPAWPIGADSKTYPWERNYDVSPILAPFALGCGIQQIYSQ